MKEVVRINILSIKGHVHSTDAVNKETKLKGQSLRNKCLKISW